MRGPRLTISGMLAVVGLLALGMAALFSAAPFWISLAAATTLALLLSMVLGVIFLRGGERAYCLGFVLFGVVYLVLVEWDWIGGQLGHDLALALGELADRVYPDPMISSPAPVLTQLPLEMLRARQTRIGNFVEVGRMLAALIFGLLGGYMAVFMDRRRRQDRPAGPS